MYTHNFFLHTYSFHTAWHPFRYLFLFWNWNGRWRNSSSKSSIQAWLYHSAKIKPCWQFSLFTMHVVHRKTTLTYRSTLTLHVSKCLVHVRTSNFILESNVSQSVYSLLVLFVESSIIDRAVKTHFHHTFHSSAW